VKSPEQAARVATFADGVVVGSHFVGKIAEHRSQITVIESSIGVAGKAMKEAMQA
jgi:tryptophan synthase alpha subunit